MGWVLIGVALVGLPISVQVLVRLRQQAREGDGLGLMQGMALRAALLVAGLVAVAGIGVALALGWDRWVMAVLGGVAGVVLAATALSMRRGIRRLDSTTEALRENARRYRSEGDNPWRS